MKISSTGLQAFTQTAWTLNITQAAKDLGLTQSALSQRLALLESDLEVTLFIREPRGLQLTEAGQRLLRFATLNQKVEEELLFELKGHSQELAGTFRIGGYSSVLRSVLIPALMPFLRKHPKVQIDFQSYEIFELPEILKSARADLIVMDYSLQKKNILEEVIGHEEYVVIESAKHESPADLYLDHGPEDNATEAFFRGQAKAPAYYRRAFMGDVYGIIDGVEAGLGRAVMSRHLISDNSKIKQLKNFGIAKKSVTLHYFEQPYYSRLAQSIHDELKTKAGKFLDI